MTTKMRRAEYKFPQAVPEEPQQDKRMPDQEQDSIVVAAKTVRISLSGQQQRKTAAGGAVKNSRNTQKPAKTGGRPSGRKTGRRTTSKLRS